MAKREDLRHLSVCSVDPPGCTDIDDALHCRELENGNLEVHKIHLIKWFFCVRNEMCLLLQVGVHIADVSHFIRPGTALDGEAANRGTTVYLCGRVST